MQALLSFEKAPPFAAPLRFFLTAPLFGMLAGLLLLWDGPAVFASRWSPGALAATHLITIGFMMQAMLGALIQILPVVAGVNIPQSLNISRGLHLGLSSGALLLAAGFVLGMPDLLILAASMLALSIASFLLVVGFAMFLVKPTSPTIRGIKLAMFGMAGVLALGVVLVMALARGWPIPLIALTDLHVAWGLGAWGGVLLAAVAYVVVPMFQLTPGYPARLSWVFPWLMLACLALWSIAVLTAMPRVGDVAQGLVCLLGILFSGFTLRLQSRRRRARADATYHYWQLGLCCAIFALIMGLTATVWPALAERAEWPLLLGLLLLVGGFISFIAGMFYKIVPFLAWMHLQSLGEGKVMAPAMNKILAETLMQRQMLSHVVAFSALVAAVFIPEWMARTAGFAFMVSNGFLLWNLLGATHRYRQHLTVIAEKMAVL